MGLQHDCDCLQKWDRTYPRLSERLLVVSGTRFNRQECTFRCCTSCPTNTAVEGLSARPHDDPELEVLHFTSGNSRYAVKTFLQERVAARDAVKEFVASRRPDPSGQRAPRHDSRFGRRT